MNRNKYLSATVGAFALALSASASANTVIVNFDGLANGDGVNGYYSGGTSASGASGPNLGVSFSGIRAKPDLSAPTPPNVGFNALQHAGINTSFGFSSVAFASRFQLPGTVSVYSGLNGAGALLGQLSGVLGGPSNYSSFFVPFAGTAHSVLIDAAPLSANFDDLRFGTVAGAGGVPEPAAWALMLMGFGFTGAAMRRRRETVRIAFA